MAEAEEGCSVWWECDGQRGLRAEVFALPQVADAIGGFVETELVSELVPGGGGDGGGCVAAIEDSDDGV